MREISGSIDLYRLYRTSVRGFVRHSKLFRAMATPRLWPWDGQLEAIKNTVRQQKIKVARYKIICYIFLVFSLIQFKIWKPMPKQSDEQNKKRSSIVRWYFDDFFRLSFLFVSSFVSNIGHAFKYLRLGIYAYHLCVRVDKFPRNLKIFSFISAMSGWKIRISVRRPSQMGRRRFRVCAESSVKRVFL